MQLISTEKLVPNGYNPNQVSDEDFKNLIDRIENAGFLESNPILVRPVDSENGKYEIVDGEHRWKAAKQLGIKEVPCDVREMDDLEAQRHCVIRNMDRGTPDYFKLSKLFNDNLEKGLQQKDLVKQYGFSKGAVSHIVSIYPQLKDIEQELYRYNFSNKDLMNIARIREDSFRYAFVKYICRTRMESSDIQVIASRCNRISDYIDEKTQKYLFSWDEIPGNDNGKLIDFLEKNFNIDWVKTAKIQKIDDGKTIRVYTEKNSLLLKLNDEKTEVNLKIDEGGTDDLPLPSVFKSVVSISSQ